VSISSTIECLDLDGNCFDSATYLAMATALRVNTSLRYLDLNANKTIDRTRIGVAFIEALRLNPTRPATSAWFLYSCYNKFSQLRAKATALGPLSMLEQLRHCDRT
jgi:hypothetical protein